MTATKGQDWMQTLEVGQEIVGNAGRVRIVAIRRNEEGRVTGFSALPIADANKRARLRRPRKEQP